MRPAGRLVIQRDRHILNHQLLTLLFTNIRADKKIDLFCSILSLQGNKLRLWMPSFLALFGGELGVACNGSVDVLRWMGATLRNRSRGNPKGTVYQRTCKRLQGAGGARHRPVQRTPVRKQADNT
ncbi:MAG: hypothetical protein PHI97_19025, partial [Desulfobulbus sp.]|nr:hypothetical protein [Desulfobulbus sp.]